MRSTCTVRPRARIQVTSWSRPSRSASVRAMRHTPPPAVAPRAAWACNRAMSRSCCRPSSCNRACCSAHTSSAVRPTMAAYTPGAVAPSLLISSTRALASSPAALPSWADRASTCSAARPATADSPATSGRSPCAPSASTRMESSAWASDTVMKKSTAGCRKRQASGEVSPHARPAITESTVPSARVGRQARALCSRQSACSGSTTITVGRRAPKRSQKPLTMPAAMPPTPPCRITCVQGQSSASPRSASSSSAMTP